MVTDDRYLTTDELAQRLSMTNQALRHLRYKNEGPPFVKIGKRVRYFLPDVVEWEQTQRQPK
jgi:predicted DNA-binding transcriptional regulator AlpA